MIEWSKATTMDPVEPGTYEATVIQLKFVPSTKSSGKPGLRFDFTLTEPHVEGKKAFSTKSLDPAGLWSTKEWLTILGADPADLERNMTMQEFMAKLAEWNAAFSGQAVRVVLSTYNDTATGDLRQSVDKLMSQFDI